MHLVEEGVVARLAILQWGMMTVLTNLEEKLLETMAIQKKVENTVLKPHTPIL